MSESRPYSILLISVQKWEINGSGTAAVVDLLTDGNFDGNGSWLFELDQEGSADIVISLDPDSFCQTFKFGNDDAG